MSERVRHGFSRTHVSSVSARLVNYDWVWARENAAAIERHWHERVRDTPSIFDGTVLLSCGGRIMGDICEVAFFETCFSRFIAARDWQADDTGVFNAFSAIVPHTADGAVLLGAMAAHTANAGQIYFPCGTPDRNDLRPGGCVDLAASAERELFEETGLAAPDNAKAASWVLLRGDAQLAFLRPVRFAETCDALVARVAAHLERDAEPELFQPFVARGIADIDPVRMPRFVQAYLEEAFG